MDTWQVGVVSDIQERHGFIRAGVQEKVYFLLRACADRVEIKDVVFFRSSSGLKNSFTDYVKKVSVAISTLEYVPGVGIRGPQWDFDKVIYMGTVFRSTGLDLLTFALPELYDKRLKNDLSVLQSIIDRVPSYVRNFDIEKLLLNFDVAVVSSYHYSKIGGDSDCYFKVELKSVGLNDVLEDDAYINSMMKIDVHIGESLRVHGSMGLKEYESALTEEFQLTEKAQELKESAVKEFRGKYSREQHLDVLLSHFIAMKSDRVEDGKAHQRAFVERVFGEFRVINCS